MEYIDVQKKKGNSDLNLHMNIQLAYKTLWHIIKNMVGELCLPTLL